MILSLLSISAEVQRCRVAEVQRFRGAEVQRCRDAEVQRCRGAEGLPFQVPFQDVLFVDLLFPFLTKMVEIIL